MSMLKALLLAVFCSAGAALAADSGSPDLGALIEASQLEALNYTVFPDGRGLPAGSGSVAAGEAIYQRRCLACHGAVGKDGINDQLAGGHGTLKSQQPLKTVGSYWPYATTLFDYVRRAMPYNAPGTLSSDQVYAVTAYLLYINDIVDAETELDASSLPQVEMPNRQGFYWSAEAR